ncbi:MAG: hypothetical protein EGQ22_07670 [Senegalimassilia anaerobia]|nr:hypothetical protein [Senegalimassilia anaerobia]
MMLLCGMQRFSQAATMISRRDDADGLPARASPASWHDKRIGGGPQQLSIVAARGPAASGKAKEKAAKLLFTRGTGIVAALGATAEARKVSFRLQLRA